VAVASGLVGWTVLQVPLAGLHLARQVRDLQPRPLSAQKVVCTQQDYVKLCLAWNRATLGEAYQRCGRKNPAWDAAAGRLLEAAAQDLASGPERPTQEQFLAAAQPLRAAQCTDPLAQYAIAEALLRNDQPADAAPYLEAAVQGFRDRSYPRQRAWLAAQELVRLSPQLGKAPSPELAQTAAEWFLQAVREKLPPGQERAFLGAARALFGDDGPTGRIGQEIALLAGRRGGSKWFLLTLAGDYAENEAWAARGTGWAKDVPPGAWKIFHQHLALAKRDYESAYDLHPDYPEPAAELVGAANAERGLGETPRLWFNRAIAAQFDWEPAYREYINSLLSRWGGSPQELRAFGEDCLATGRYDTLVPEQYYRVVTDLDEMESQPQIWQDPDVYAHLKKMFEGLAAEPSRARDLPHWATLYAAVAYKTAHWPDAARAFKLAGPAPDEDAFFERSATRWPQARGMALLAVSPQGPQAQQADALYHQGKLAQAQSVFEKLLAANQDPLITPYLQDRVDAIRMQVPQPGEEWRNLLSPQLAGWELFHVKAQPLAGGAVRLTVENANLPEGGLPLLLSDFENSGNCEFYVVADIPNVNANDLFYFFPIAQVGSESVDMLSVAPAAGQASFFRDGIKDPQIVALGPGPEHQFSLKLYQGKATVTVDGKLLVRDYPLDPDRPPSAKVGMMLTIGAPTGVILSWDPTRNRPPWAVTLKVLKVRPLHASP
jgi:hypothetical protein